MNVVRSNAATIAQKFMKGYLITKHYRIEIALYSMSQNLMQVNQMV